MLFKLLTIIGIAMLTMIFFHEYLFENLKLGHEKNMKNPCDIIFYAHNVNYLTIQQIVFTDE